jgi:hypothetical protein
MSNSKVRDIIGRLYNLFSNPLKFHDEVFKRTIKEFLEKSTPKE